MTVATQQERVLAALHANPLHGVCQIDFLGPATIDGGPPITRLAARIDELRNQGTTIEVAGRRKKCAVYRLLDAEGGDAPTPPSSSAQVGRIIPLAAGQRWFCNGTWACQGVPLDGPVCPRGADHRTYVAWAVGYGEAVAQDERMAA